MADPIDCGEAKARLHDYLKRELTPELAVEVRVHLERCRSCFDQSKFEESFLRMLEERAQREVCPGAAARAHPPRRFAERPSKADDSGPRHRGGGHRRRARLARRRSHRSGRRGGMGDRDAGGVEHRLGRRRHPRRLFRPQHPGLPQDAATARARSQGGEPRRAPGSGQRRRPRARLPLRPEGPRPRPLAPDLYPGRRLRRHLGQFPRRAEPDASPHAMGRPLGPAWHQRSRDVSSAARELPPVPG